MKKYKTKFKINVPHEEITGALSSLSAMYEVEVSSITSEGVVLILTPRSTEYAEAREEGERYTPSPEELRKDFLKEKIKTVVIDEATDYLYEKNPLKAILSDLNRYTALIDELTSKEYDYTLEEILKAAIELQKGE